MVDANQLTGDNWQLAVVRGERLEVRGAIGNGVLAIGNGVLAIGYWLLDIGDIIQQHLRSHNATSAEEGRAIDSGYRREAKGERRKIIGYWLLAMGYSYLAFARTITCRARVRQLTIDN